jgi:biopolymer transport protein ExbD
VTPLVDVVLVLLIIFMVVIPKMLEKIHVDIPAVFNPDPKYSHVIEPATVIMTADKQIYIDDMLLADIDALAQQLDYIKTEIPDRRLLVKADASLKFKEVRPLLEKAQDAGFKGTGFVVGAKHKVEKLNKEKK